MLRLWTLFGIVLVVSLIIETNGLVPRKRKKPKKMKASDMSNLLMSLQKNVSTLTSEMKQMESSRVMVHVHGLEHDPSDTHEGEDGTHVHIHMHMDGAEGQMGHGHHGRMDHDHMDHGPHGDIPEEHANHGFHGMPHKMMHGGKAMMKFMHEHMHFPEDENTYLYGHCEMAMNPKLAKSPHAIKGAIHLRQKMHGPLETIIHLKGFHVPKGAHADHNMHVHGFHVHEFGDISNGCQSFGGHFNPDGVDHGSKQDETRHAGDWGNIACDDQGEVHMNSNDTHVSLIGTHSIIGRGIVIHEVEDDLGLGGVAASKKTGNAGGRVACCTVGWAAEHDWNTLEKHGH